MNQPPQWPQQGQPWQPGNGSYEPPGYQPWAAPQAAQGQPGPYGVPPGFPPHAQPPRRKPKRGRTAGVAAGIIAAAVIVIAALASHKTPSHTVTAAGATASAAAETTARAKSGTDAGNSAQAGSSAKGASGTARIGSSITLAGNDAGEQMTVTVTRVLRHAVPTSDFEAPQAGDRLYAVQFRLADTGSLAYSDAPDNGAVLVDSAGQSYQSTIASVIGCHTFPGTENIPAGGTGLGCVVFEVPAKAVIVSVQFTLDSGMASQTGQWDIALKG